MKNKITEIKNTLEEISWLDNIEEQIMELDDRVVEIT